MSNDILVNQTIAILDEMDEQISETLNIAKLLNNPTEMEKQLTQFQKIGKTNVNEIMSITKEEIKKNESIWKKNLSSASFSLLERIANSKAKLNETKQKIIDRIRISVNFGNRSYFLSPLIRVFDRLSDPNWLKNPNATEISGYMANFVLNITKNQLLNSLSDIPITGPIAANAITTLDAFAAAPPIFAKMDEMLKKYGVGSVIPSAVTQTSSIMKMYMTFRDLVAGNFSITSPSSTSSSSTSIPTTTTTTTPQQIQNQMSSNGNDVNQTPTPPTIVIIKEKINENNQHDIQEQKPQQEQQPKINPPVDNSVEGGGIGIGEGKENSESQKRKKNNYDINLLDDSSNQILSRIHKQIQTYFTYRQKQKNQMPIYKHIQQQSNRQSKSNKTKKRKYDNKRKKK